MIFRIIRGLDKSKGVKFGDIKGHLIELIFSVYGLYGPFNSFKIIVNICELDHRDYNCFQSQLDVPVEY